MNDTVKNDRGPLNIPNYAKAGLDSLPDDVKALRLKRWQKRIKIMACFAILPVLRFCLSMTLGSLSEVRLRNVRSFSPARQSLFESNKFGNRISEGL